MRYIFIAAAFLFVFQACKKVDLDNIDNLNNGKIDVVGHAGSGFQSLINPLPSNSFTSIKKAVDALNVDGFEMDLKITVDSLAVLYHDDILEKSTNCAGCPEKYTGHDLLNCKYKNFYGSRVVNEENLISLEHLINYFKDRTKHPHMYATSKLPTECTLSDPNAAEKFAIVISRLIHSNNAQSWISVCDSDVNLLNRIREYEPNVNLIYNAQHFEGAVDTCVANNFSEIVIGNNEITKEEIKQAHLHNIKVTLWGIVTRNDVIDAIEKHPDALMTDNIELTQEVLRK